jgi:large subunit ribosomal protein L21
MYAIVKTGGKQYRVEQGQSLLVERLPDGEGAKLELEPLLFVDGSEIVDGEDLAKVKVQARVVGQERGPKLRVVKFKPKRGYKRRTGHRQELTRLEVTEIKLGSRRRTAAKGSGSGPKAAASSGGTEEGGSKPTARRKPPARKAAEAKAEKKPARPRAEKPARPRTRKEEDEDGS